MAVSIRRSNVNYSEADAAIARSFAADAAASEEAVRKSVKTRGLKSAFDHLENKIFGTKASEVEGGKHRYVTAKDVLADLAPPEIARKLRVVNVAKKAAGAPRYSSHMFFDAQSVAIHALAARKILSDPSLIERVRSTLERWISKQTPAPPPFIEWRHILRGTPQEIAAVALSLTEEATRPRSSSPLLFFYLERASRDSRCLW
jgi:hypothetical protein